MDTNVVTSGSGNGGTWLKRCGWLTAAGAAFWLVLAVPAYLLGGSAGLEGLSYAAVLCLVPGVIVFVIASRFAADSASPRQAYVPLLGAGLRLLFVLCGVLVATDVRPHLGMREFLVWVIAFYFAMLAVETWFLMKDSGSSGAAST